MFKGDVMGLKDKKVLITAGAQGLGLEMAELFLSYGCQVLVSDVNADALEQAQAKHPTLHENRPGWPGCSDQ